LFNFKISPMNPYVLAFKRPEELVEEFKKIGVDWGGSKIMRLKGISRCVKLHKVPHIAANILKQEMLSLGGDVALSRGTLTGKDKTTDCLILGSVAQIFDLAEKLKKQPFGLAQCANELKGTMNFYEQGPVFLNIGGKRRRTGQRTLVMGILNVTPDSFSGDGIVAMGPAQKGRIVPFHSGAGLDRGLALARDMVACGADILDIGGESTRPGSKRISAAEERGRVVPFLKRLRKTIRVPFSIDTMKSEVAHAALDAGVDIVNDVSALRFDKKMAKLVSRYKAALILMHMKGTPEKMQINPRYDDLLGEVVSFLREAVQRAQDAGVAREKIVIDPGIGFGKTWEHNCGLLRRLSVLKSLGRPILVGLSRKSFIGKILDADVDKRVMGTAAATALAIAQGADMIRVHDCHEMSQAARVADAILRREKTYGG
jgi:dihydropteroate synthase